MISVAMTTYNGEKYVINQLDSIRNQTCYPDEVIISDDHSTDATVSLVKEYVHDNKLKRWNVISNTSNQGYIKNFWKTILLTTGDYIFLADQDDIWQVDKIKSMTEIMKEKSALMLHTEVDVIDNEERIIRKHMNRLPYGIKKIGTKSYMKKSHYCGMSSAISGDMRELMRQINIENFPTHDWCLGYIASIFDAFYTDNHVYSLRRSHENNAALKTDKEKRGGIVQRISAIEHFQRLYRSALSISMDLDSNDKVIGLVDSFIDTNERRIESLESKSIIAAIRNLKNINWYPSNRAWISDLMYILRVF